MYKLACIMLICGSTLPMERSYHHSNSKNTQPVVEYINLPKSTPKDKEPESQYAYPTSTPKVDLTKKIYENKYKYNQ